jgi:hypothetical protein
VELFVTEAVISGNYFKNNSIQGKMATTVGGALRIFHSAFYLENNIFTENTAEYGGAIHIRGTPETEADLLIMNNTLINNQASYKGGGMYMTKKSMSSIQ